MVLGLVQAAHENTLHNKSVSLRLLHDLLPNFSRSQEVRSAPASTQSMVHRMRTVEHASPLHTVGAEESSVQVRRPNNFVEPSRSRDVETPLPWVTSAWPVNLLGAHRVQRAPRTPRHTRDTQG
ncbi:unnamed protein product [Prorocentrum cordatum]|uniref:Uncharacterized protein n=1 Tax=Prorocentrum cordatum TaxID=2364126 RepID=A0ABN9XXX8_9DINO|nr:unnamed protein product [Polarella glacialis]